MGKRSKLVARIPGTRSGAYYVLVHERVASRASYTLTAELLGQMIDELSVSQVGNVGSATIRISGAGFSPETTVRLEGADRLSLLAPEPYVQDSGTIFAGWNLDGVPAGSYLLVVGNPDGSSASEPIEIIDAAGGEFYAQLHIPPVVRPNRPYTFTLEYGNTGHADVLAPLVGISVGDNCQIRRSSADEFSASPIQLLAIAHYGPAGRLPPGSRFTVDMELKVLANVYVPFYLSVIDQTNQELLDWNALEEALRPGDVTDDEWTPLSERIRAQVGETWGDYAKMLSENATHLSEVMRSPWRLLTDADADGPSPAALVVDPWFMNVGLQAPAKLFAFEFVQASVMGAPPYLESVQDAFCPAPGLPLGFVRHFRSRPSYRARLGALGRGWTHSYAISLRTRSDGAVVVNSPNGFDRTFELSGSAYAASPGDYGSLTRQPDNTFVLTEKGGVKTVFRVDGLFDHIEDTNGNRVTAEYDGGGRLTEVRHSSGDAFDFDYDAPGRLLTLTDHAGRITDYTYDGPGEHLVAVTRPDGNETAYRYLVGEGELRDHSLASASPPGGPERSYEYDELGRLSRQFVAAGEEAVEHDYGAAGKAFVTNAVGNTTTSWINEDGQIARVRDPLGNAVDMVYDGAGNLTATIGPTGLTSRFAYDASGNLVSAIDPMWNRTEFGYASGLSKLSWVEDARGNATNYDYDAAGNLLSITYANGSVESWSHDAGNPVTWTNRRGSVIGYAYNARGQLQRKTHPDGTEYTYGYEEGRLVAATDTRGATMQEYDPDTGWLTEVVYPKGRALSFQYDAAGRRTKMTTHDGFVTNYEYDEAGRLSRLTDAADVEIIRYSYDDDGRLTREDKGNGTYTTYKYDAVGQILELDNLAPDGTPHSYFHYTYDALGRRTRMATHYGTWTYEYDRSGQLTHAVLDSTDPEIEDQDLAYVYDAVGNRVRTVINGVTTEYATNEMNQYTRVGTTVYRHDADGNVVSRSGDGQVWTHNYSVENRLTDGSQTEGSFTYEYDVLGNRTASVRSGVRVTCLPDPMGLGNVVSEYSGGGDVRARYCLGLGLVSRSAAEGSPAYYAFDAVGSTSELTGLGGHVLSSCALEPFGSALSPQQNSPERSTFVGRWGVARDGVELLYMRNRYYMPSLGAFLAADPMSDLNSYTYAANCPVSLIDPDGLRSIRVSIGQRPLGNLLGRLGGGRRPFVHWHFFVDTGDSQFDVGLVRDVNSARGWSIGPDQADRALRSRYRTRRVLSVDAALFYRALNTVKTWYETYGWAYNWKGRWRGMLPCVNCQDFIEDVMAEYYRLLAEKGQKAGGTTGGGRWTRTTS